MMHTSHALTFAAVLLFAGCSGAGSNDAGFSDEEVAFGERAIGFAKANQLDSIHAIGDANLDGLIDAGKMQELNAALPADMKSVTPIVKDTVAGPDGAMHTRLRFDVSDAKTKAVASVVYRGGTPGELTGLFVNAFPAE